MGWSKSSPRGENSYMRNSIRVRAAFSTMCLAALTTVIGCQGEVSNVTDRARESCLLGRGTTRWNSLPPPLKEPTYRQFCDDEATWAATMCRLIDDPNVSPKDKKINSDALIVALGPTFRCHGG